VRYCS
jgi:hypothetical protein